MSIYHGLGVIVYLLVVALWTLRLICGGDMGSSAALRLPFGDDGDMVIVSSVS